MEHETTSVDTSGPHLPPALKQKLLLAILILLGSLFGLGALFAAVLQDHIDQYILHMLIELSVGFFSFAAITKIIDWFRVRDPLGVERVFREWIRDKPSSLQIRKEFAAAHEIDIIGVTLYYSMIGEKWFARRLLKRLTARQPTRLLLLKKSGQEIRRRNDEPRRKEKDGLTLLERNQKAHEIIESVHAQSGNGRIHDVMRSFDYSPGINLIRIDDAAYIVFLSERGGYSPALKVRRGSILFQHYTDMFDFIWERHPAPVSSEPPDLVVRATG